MSLFSFDLDAGALCLDFANTADWHASPAPVERLNDIPDLIRWAEAAGVLSAEQAQELRDRAGREPVAAGLAFERAIQLRETVYSLFAHYAERGAGDARDLADLNEALSGALPRQRIVLAGQGFGWDWVEGPAQFEQVAWSVARSAAELLTSEQLSRVRQCADDRGCGYLFIDSSRNHSRRWCSMESCGNRAKARRHYRKRK